MGAQTGPLRILGAGTQICRPPPSKEHPDPSVREFMLRPSDNEKGRPTLDKDSLFFGSLAVRAEGGARAWVLCD